METAKEDAIYSDDAFDAVTDAFLKQDYIEMLKAAKVLVSRHPDSSKSHFWLGRAFGGLNFNDDAIAELRQAIKLKPDSATAWFILLIFA